ncbi:hypothetical protein TH66_12450 [Carbonactinospora thermoautotrophica]|uniref:DUF4190 domain-containing protein n=1 Tax=Carbonactinospora thermoautotrophica TaxID=1469144 RepID=A0A132N0H8_9ACTN|nr:DUF4190 domain-containing protein [Carbonactinospora thermoautotrophica]KWX03639.1 hypothetical protein TH66_12450 [Carbonactinospora thermoautotrophica]
MTATERDQRQPGGSGRRLDVPVAPARLAAYAELATRPELPQRNAPGIAAVLLAVLGLFLCWALGIGAVPAIAGLACGGVALRRARAGQASRPLAVTGLVLAGLALAVSVFFLVVEGRQIRSAEDCFDRSRHPTWLDRQHCLEQQLRSGEGR